jgi:hypothetical protein
MGISMIGRFILHCDTEYFDLAKEAVEFLMENPQHRETMYSQTDGSGGIDVQVFAKRLKGSITVRQVRP